MLDYRRRYADICTYALTNTNAKSLPAAAFAPAFKSFDNDCSIVALLPTKLVIASIGGTVKSRLFDPEPQPIVTVPSLQVLSPPEQSNFGILASCPTTAILEIVSKVRGRPRVVFPAVLVTLLFLRRTAEAAPISRTRAVCASVRTLTFWFRLPEPSGCWASKLISGKP